MRPSLFRPPARLLLARARRAPRVRPRCGASLAPSAPTPRLRRLAGRRKTVLHVGWQRARQPQSLHRLPDVHLRALPPQLRLPRRYHAGTCAPSPAGHKLVPLGGRQGVDVPVAEGVTWQDGNPSPRRRRLHLRLRDRQPDDELHELHRLHQEGRDRGPADGEVHLLAAQGQHAPEHRVHPPRAHLEQGEPQGRRQQLHQPAAHGRDRPVPGRRVEARRVRAPWPTSTTGEAHPRSTRSSSSSIKTPTRWTQDLKNGTIQFARVSPPASSGR